MYTFLHNDKRDLIKNLKNIYKYKFYSIISISWVMVIGSSIASIATLGFKKLTYTVHLFIFKYKAVEV